MTFFNNLFATKETKETLKTLHEIGKDILQKLEKKSPFELYYVWTITEQETKKLILSNSKKLTEAIKGNKTTPKTIVLNMINEVSRNQLMTGNHHHYRTLLSRTGQAFLDIFEYTVICTEKMEFITKEESKQIMEEFQEDIKYAG